MVEAEVAARVGESALLQCKVDFASDNTSIMWTRVAHNSADFNLVSYQGRRTRQSFVKQEDGSTSVLSQLIIPEVTEEDFSAFGCFAQNELGSDLKMVELKNLDNTISWLVLTVTTNLFLLMAFLAVVLLYWYKKKLPIAAEGDESQRKQEVAAISHHEGMFERERRLSSQPGGAWTTIGFFDTTAPGSRNFPEDEVKLDLSAG